MANPVGNGSSQVTYSQTKLNDDRVKLVTKNQSEIRAIFGNSDGSLDIVTINALPLKTLELFIKRTFEVRNMFRQQPHVLNMDTAQKVDTEKLDCMLDYFDATFGLFLKEQDEAMVLDVDLVNLIPIVKFRLLMKYNEQAQHILYDFEGLDREALDALPEKYLEALLKHPENTKRHFFKKFKLDVKEIKKHPLKDLEKSLSAHIEFSDDSFSK